MRSSIGWVVTEVRRKARNQAFQNVASLYAINGGVAVFSLLTNIKLANVLGPAQFGLFSYALAVATYGAVLTRYGREKSMVRSLVQHPERTRETIAGTVIVSSALLLAVSFLLGPYLWEQEPELGIAGLVIAFTACASSLDLQPVYDSWRKMGRHAMYHGLQRLLFIAIVWLTICCFPSRVGLPMLAIASVAGLAPSLFLQYREVRSVTGYKLFRRENVEESVRVLQLGFPLAIAMFASCAFGPSVRVFLKNYTSSAELGVFSAAWQIVMIATFALQQIGRVGNPAMARIAMPSVAPAERRRTVGKYAMLMLFAAMPIAAPCLCFPKLIAGRCFKPEYGAVADLLPVFGWYILLLALGIVASQFLISLNKDRWYLGSVIFGGAIGILLCVRLIPTFGAMGAAWSLTLSHSVSLFLYIAGAFRVLVTRVTCDGSHVCSLPPSDSFGAEV